MTQVRCIIKGEEYTLDLEPPTFDCRWRERNIHGRRCLILYWQQRTQFRNIISSRMIVCHLGWPFITHVTGIRDLEEKEDG